MKDYYKILGVEEEASEEEIRARWIELTKYYHPDLGKTEEGDEKIKEINEAYEILKDEPARFQYDFERDLKRSFIKKAHRRQARRMNIRKVVIPSGIVALFLIAGFIILILRPGGGVTPTGTEARTEVVHEIDKVSEKMTASPTPSVGIGSKAQSERKAPMEIKEGVIPQESKREAMPLESTEMASLRPPQSPSEVEREPEKKKEPVQKILPELKVLPGVEKEPPAKKELESEGKLAPQVVVKPERPATKEVPKEVPKEIPKEVPKEAPRQIAKEVPREVPREVPKEIPREIPKEVAKEVAKEVPKVILKEIPKEGPKEVVKEVAKEVPEEIPREVPKEVAREVSKEIPREVPKEAPRQIAKEVPKEVPREAPKEVPKELPKEVAKEVVKEVPKVIPKEIPKQVAKEIPKEGPKEAAKEIPREVPKEVSKKVPKEIPKQVAKEIPKEGPKEVVKEVAKEVPKELPKEVSRVTLHPGENLTMWTKGERVVPSRPSLLAKEEEVKQFFSNYVNRYHRKDVDGFLSCFSSRAIQNQTDRLEAIRLFYTKVFDQSQDLRYQIEGMKIEISQNRVDVKARFRVDQKLKKDGEDKVWKGNVRWVLIKEEGRLKIISLDYQNEKSP